MARLGVSRETAALLDRFVDHLLRWQTTTQLIAPSTIANLWTRHILDSAQLVPLGAGAAGWLDIGSGGGLPGLVIAILIHDRPGACVHLVESNSRKAAFLSEAIRITGAPARVHAARMEEIAPSLVGEIGIVTARAVAPLSELLALAAPLLKTGARGLFLKGRHAAQELTDAAQYWRLDAELIPSMTDRAARLVHVRAAVPASDRDEASA